jgi:hypothetical protein
MLDFYSDNSWKIRSGPDLIKIVCFLLLYPVIAFQFKSVTILTRYLWYQVE